MDYTLEVSFKDFIQWALSLLSLNEQKEISPYLYELDWLQSVSEALSFEKWLKVFENHFIRTEKVISTGKDRGVFILSLDGAMGLALKNIFVLGLSENNLTENQRTSLTWTDVESIKSKFGFNLPHTDNHRLTKQLQWFQLKQAREIIFSYSETDFSGQFQAPGFFWLDGIVGENKGRDSSFQAGTLLSPLKTRWDEIMEYNPGLRIKNNEEFSSVVFDEFLVTEPVVTGSKGQTKGLKKQKKLSLSDHLENLQEKLEMDKGGGEMEDLKIFSFSLSASSLEEYFKCPFRFFARNKLHLDKSPSLDIHIDPMTRGSLVHKLCEKVISDEKFSLSQNEVEKLVEQTRQSMKMPIYNKEIWKFQKSFYVRLILKFMESERLWCEQYPLCRTYGVEEEIKTKIKITDEGFCFSDQGDISFKGYVDRIDCDGKGQFAVIDYKTSGADLVQFGSWLKKGQFQLLLYSLALADGVFDNKPKDVVAAFYFILKTVDRTKGFFSDKASLDFLPSKRRVPDSKIKNLFSETRELVGNLLRDIQKGKFYPNPRDYKTCENCQWNKICRAPHLNH